MTPLISRAVASMVTLGGYDRRVAWRILFIREKGQFVSWYIFQGIDSKDMNMFRIINSK